MPKDDLADSDSQEEESNSSSEELETPISGGNQKMSEYEKQRMRRIEENRARMEAFGLSKMASSFMGSVQKAKKKNVTKGKGKEKGAEEDEEYKPSAGEDGSSSSSVERDDDEEFVGGNSSRPRSGKVKKRSTPMKKVPVQKLMHKQHNSDFIDDDEDLLQAIALSLQGNQSCDAHPVDERKEDVQIRGDTLKRKRKKPVTSRVQLTGDELLMHFFQFDEAGKGTITIRDLERVAAAHDFTWSEEEIADMIYCFDSDRDGKLSLDDFRKIVGRCNMIQSSEPC